MPAITEDSWDLPTPQKDNEKWFYLNSQPVVDEHIIYTHSRTEIHSSDYKDQTTFYHDSMSPEEIKSRTLSSFSYTQENPHPEISLIVCNSQLHQNYTYSFRTAEAGLVFSTIVSGEIENILPQKLHGRTNKSQKIRFSACDAVYSFQGYQGFSTIYRHTPFRYVSLVLSLEAVQRMLEELAYTSEGTRPVALKKMFNLISLSTAGSYATQLTALQILSCSMSGFPRKLYIESKCLELLSHHLERLQLSSQGALGVTRADRERLEEARRIISTQINNPPTIRKLAQLCGTNEFKLKKQYKQVFGQTIYETVRKARLAKAMYLMQEGEQSLVLIAETVGYSLPHFVTIFKKEYGVTPGKFTRNFLYHR